MRRTSSSPRERRRPSASFAALVSRESFRSSARDAETVAPAARASRSPTAVPLAARPSPIERLGVADSALGDRRRFPPRPPSRRRSAAARPGRCFRRTAVRRLACAAAGAGAAGLSLLRRARGLDVRLVALPRQRSRSLAWLVVGISSSPLRSARARRRSSANPRPTISAARPRS